MYPFCGTLLFFDFVTQKNTLTKMYPLAFCILSGQRVCTRNNMSNLSSGIYIVAGKKFVVK